MQVKLIAYTPEPERVVAAAARLCYSKIGAMDILEGLTDDRVGELIDTLLTSGHLSPTEHATFVFAIEGVSRALSHQCMRHRIASYSQQSQRWVDESNFDYIVPASIRESAQAFEIFVGAMESLRDAYRKLMALVPREDARYVLPNACETKFVMSMNCRSLYNFFEKRLCTRAQWEIREMAAIMLEEVRKVAPRLFAKAGPPCETRGICPEGKFSCGRIASRAPANNT
ncbi:MAG TPA: FAD-dependent thymidylate synthase [Firmicutes bacterium]|nr:FAD-dependent thymidylate synthase [Bacillota bacterium]